MTRQTYTYTLSMSVTICLCLCSLLTTCIPSVDAFVPTRTRTRTFKSKSSFASPALRTQRWMKDEDEDVDTKKQNQKLGKPINLPSLQSMDAGPMFGTCRSVTGVEEDYAAFNENVENYNSQEEMEMEGMNVMKDFNGGDDDGNTNVTSGDSSRPSFFGLEPKDEALRQKDGSMNVSESGLPLFTSIVVLGWTCYGIYIALFTDQL